MTGILNLLTFRHVETLCFISNLKIEYIFRCDRYKSSSEQTVLTEGDSGVRKAGEVCPTGPGYLHD
jgi:hypothetical protein